MKILTASFCPLYAQIAVIDPDVPDAYPEWATGDEDVVVGDHGVAFGTVPDSHGDVVVDIFTDEELPIHHRVIYDGPIDVTGTDLVVGSVTANQIARIAGLSPGRKRLVIGTPDAPGEVRRVAICVGLDE